MTHKFDIDEADRMKKAKRPGTYFGVQKSWSLYELACSCYDTTIVQSLIDPERFEPTDESDEVEAALFATAWNHNPQLFFERFGEASVVSLFKRYACEEILGGLPDTEHPITVFRGTCAEPQTPFNRAMSWTLSRDTAISFATGNRCSTPVILTGEVSPADVLMAVADDEEKELVVKSNTVNITKQEILETVEGSRTWVAMNN